MFSEPYREVLKGIIHKAGYDHDIDIVELEIPEDHIHMVVCGVPKMCPSNVMQVLKSIFSKRVFSYISRDKETLFFGM